MSVKISSQQMEKYDAVLSVFLEEYIDAPRGVTHGFWRLDRLKMLTTAGIQALLLYLIKNRVFDSGEEIAKEIVKSSAQLVPVWYINHFIYNDDTASAGKGE